MSDRINITGRVANLAGDLLRMLQTRLEMLSVELQRERNATMLQLKLGVISAITAALAGVSAILWVALSVSPEKRSVALAALTAAFILISVTAVFIARHNQQSQRRLFDRLIAQLELDRSVLRRPTIPREKERHDESSGGTRQAA